MRVTLVGPTYPHRGGIVHYTNSLVTALHASEGTTVQLQSFSRLFPRLLYKGSSYRGREAFPLPPEIPVHRDLSYGNPATWWRAGRRARSSHVVHFQMWTPFLAPAFLGLHQAGRRNSSARHVATVHNVSPHEGRDRRLAFLGHALLRRMDGVIVHSKSLVEPLANVSGLNVERIHVVPQGAYSAFGSTSADRGELRRALGFSEHDHVAIMFGLIRHYKGLDVALESLSMLDARHKLLVVGECWEPWSKYESMIERHGLKDRVRTELRYVADDEVAGFFQAADAALFPYRSFESQSAAALTALGLGLPIVVSAVGGLSDLTAPEFTVPPGDAAALASAWERLAGEGAAASGPRAPTWHEVAERTRQVYEEIMGR